MINTKLQNIIDTKAAIGNAINNKGGTITANTPFYNYASEIDNISTGSVLTGNATTGDVLNGFTFYNNDANTQLTGTLDLTGNATTNQVFNGQTFYTTDAKTKLTGTFTFTGNATTGDVSTGKTFYATNGTKLTGTASLVGEMGNDINVMSFIQKSDEYGVVPNSITINNGFIYISGSTPFTVKKYYESNLGFVGNTGNYGSAINSISVASGFIYVGGGGSQRYVSKYNESTLALVGNTANFVSAISAIHTNNNFLYIGGSSSVGINRGIGKYHQSNLTLIGNSPNYSVNNTSFIIWSITTLGSSIYIGGFDNTSLSDGRVQQINDSTLAIVNNSASYGGTIEDVKANNGFVYAVGRGDSNHRNIKKYHSGNLVLSASGNDATAIVTCLDIKDGFIYIGVTGGDQCIRKYYESNLTYVANASAFGPTFGIIHSNNFVYAVGYENFSTLNGAIKKYYSNTPYATISGVRYYKLT